MRISLSLLCLLCSATFAQKHTLSFYKEQRLEDDGPVEMSYDILAIPVHAGNLQAINEKQWNKRVGDYENILLKMEDEKNDWHYKPT